MIVYLIKRNKTYKDCSIHGKINAKTEAVESNILSHPASKFLFNMISFRCWLETYNNSIKE